MPSPPLGGLPYLLPPLLPAPPLSPSPPSLSPPPSLSFAPPPPSLFLALRQNTLESHKTPCARVLPRLLLLRHVACCLSSAVAEVTLQQQSCNRPPKAAVSLHLAVTQTGDTACICPPRTACLLAAQWHPLCCCPVPHSRTWAGRPAALELTGWPSRLHLSQPAGGQHGSRPHYQSGRATLHCFAMLSCTARVPKILGFPAAAVLLLYAHRLHASGNPLDGMLLLGEVTTPRC